MRRSSFLILCALGSLPSGIPVLSAADWPQFLGPNRNGVSTEKIASEFPAEGPKILWKKSLGHGLAGPIVFDRKVILFHRESGQCVIEALAIADGKSVWRFTRPTDYRDDFGFDDGPRSAPTISGGRLFAYGADGRLDCLDANTGKSVWQHDLAADFSSPKGWFGRCCAPLAVGDQILVNVGGRASSKPVGVAAFDTATGKLAWTGSDDEASYSSPILTQFNKQPATVFFTRKGLEVLDPTKGTTFFKETFEPDISASVTACTPVMCGDNRLFLSACYGVGAAVWEVQPEMKFKQLWKNDDHLDCHYGTPVFYDGHLYGFNGRQEQGQQLRCIDAATGAVKWSSTTMPAGSVLVAGGTLVILTEKGELVLAPATPKEFKSTARGQILGSVTRAYPALADGVLYARDGKQLVAVQLAK